MKEICRYLMNALDLDQDTYDVIYYGLFVIVSNMMSIISVIFIGYMLDQLENTIILLISFGPIRLYMGGYHASSPMKCYLFFNIISIIFILGIKINISKTYLLTAVSMLLCFALIQGIINKVNRTTIIILLIYIVLSFVLVQYYCFKSFVLGTMMSLVLFEINQLLNNCKIMCLKTRVKDK